MAAGDGAAAGLAVYRVRFRLPEGSGGAALESPALDPSLVLSAWAGGIAAGLALVAAWRVVGSGYNLLATGVALLFGVSAALAGGGPAAWAGCGLVLLAAAMSRRPPVVMILAAAAACSFVGAAAVADRPLLAISGALFLGAVTSEMMLGHWYLVDPRLPRPSLRRLATIGAAGGVIDAALVAAHGGVPWDAADAVTGWAFVVLAATTVLLMVAVGLALRERGYSGVMAATGLSYLAMLTAAGAMVLGRML
jgi:hypothetical protein